MRTVSDGPSSAGGKHKDMLLIVQDRQAVSFGLVVNEPCNVCGHQRNAQESRMLVPEAVHLG